MDYSPPVGAVLGPTEYRAASEVTLRCVVTGGFGVSYQWTSTCSDCFVEGTASAVHTSSLYSTDSGKHICTATDNRGRTASDIIEMRVVGELSITWYLTTTLHSTILTITASVSHTLCASAHVHNNNIYFLGDFWLDIGW